MGAPVVEEVGGGASSAWDPIEFDGKNTLVPTTTDPLRFIKRNGSSSIEALHVAMNVVSICHQLKKCPLTEEILINMVQAVFPKQIVVAKLVNFQKLIKGPLQINPENTGMQKGLAGDPFLDLRY